jgi:hypothetical protein
LIGGAVPFYVEGIGLIIGTVWVLVFLRQTQTGKAESSSES